MLFLALSVQGCGDFLDAKPSKALVVPSNLDDFHALLDAELRGINFYPVSGLISSDDHVFGPGLIQRLSFNLNSLYFWEKETYMPDESDVNWSFPYTKIFYSNLVLDGLKDYKPESAAEVLRIKELEASARFYRATGHFEALMHFAEPFDPSKGEQLGVPIRLTSDVNIKTNRSSMREVYSQVIEDLIVGLGILPEKPSVPTRPSTWAIHAMLSRVYLTMHDYQKSYEHSDLALKIDDSLMDFKGLNSGLPYSFEIFNQEVIHYQRLLTGMFVTSAENFVNPELVSEYESSDLRLKYFFRPSGRQGFVNFRGNLTGDFYFFGGLAVDELFLNFAESAYRIGKEEDALKAVNQLLESRYSQGYQQKTGITGPTLLKMIVKERRKELLFRGIRWLDLKRHNLYPELATTLKRNFNVEGGELLPGDTRYTFLIPPAEINLNPMKQNIR